MKKLPSPVKYQSTNACPIHYVETTTNQVVYPRLIFDLRHLQSHRDLLNLPVLLHLLGRIDTERYTAEQLETMESQCCGGVAMGVSTFDRFHGDLKEYRNVQTVLASEK